MLIDSTIIDYFSNDMIFVKANAEKDDSLTAKKYSVSGYPTFVLTDSKGDEIDRIVGYLEAGPFLETVNNYLQGIGTLDDLLAKAADSADRMLYYDIAEKYKYRGGSDEAKMWYEKILAEGEPTDSLAGEVKISLADMVLRNKEYDAALADFKKIEKEFKGTPYGETAILYQAYIYRSKLNDTTKAISEYERFVKEYPNSEDAEYAANKAKELKGETEE